MRMVLLLVRNAVLVRLLWIFYVQKLWLPYLLWNFVVKWVLLTLKVRVILCKSSKVYVVQNSPLTQLGTLWMLLNRKFLVFLFVNGVIVVEKQVKWPIFYLERLPQNAYLMFGLRTCLFFFFLFLLLLLETFWPLDCNGHLF
jgi:hypothetical protein